MKNKNRNIMNIQLKHLLFILLLASVYLCNVNAQITNQEDNEWIYTFSCTSGIRSRQDPRVMRQDNTTFLLGNYLINPTERMIGRREYFTVWFGVGGAHGHGRHFVHNLAINFDNTTLFVVGNQLFFKEEMDFFPELDLNSLQILYTNLRRNKRFNFVARDKNHLYIGAIGTFYRGNNRMPFSINITGYTLINNRIFQKEDRLYFLSDRAGVRGVCVGLIRIINPEEFHLPTLEHRIENFFADKTGIYRLGGYRYQGERFYRIERPRYRYYSRAREDDIARRTRITSPFRIDENRVYSRGFLVYEPIDAENLRFIYHHGQKTRFMTDGRSLIYTRFAHSTVRRNGRIMLSISEHIISDVDFATLRVINYDVLMDKNNFYYGAYRGINVVPIDALGFDVRIFTEYGEMK